MRVEALAARDGWRCWVCEGEVDPAAPTGSPSSASIDHVVPRARGGVTEPDNLRLAHRRCNAGRGSRLPELEWPGHLGVVDGAPLWQSLTRLGRRRGSRELVAVVTTADAADAAAQWLTARAALIVGGRWAATTGPAAGELHGVWLRAE